jgi:hypothetical protein
MTCIYNTTGTNHAEVMEMGRRDADKFILLLTNIIGKL